MNNSYSTEQAVDKNGKKIVISVKTAQDGSLFIVREGVRDRRVWPRDEAEVLYQLLGKELGHVSDS